MIHIDGFNSELGMGSLLSGASVTPRQGSLVPRDPYMAIGLDFTVGSDGSKGLPQENELLCFLVSR